MAAARRAARSARSSLLALLLGSVALLGLAGGTSGLAAGSIVVGSSTLETKIDSNAPGLAEAFVTTATATATVSKLSVYVDAGSTATTAVAGIYADNAGHPGALLGQGTVSAPVAGAWNDFALPSGALVTSGQSYWIALLGPVGAGTIKFRDRQARVSKGEVSAQTNLTTLPGTWSSGTGYVDGPMSAYGSSADGGPVLAVTPASLSFAGVAGGAAPASQPLAINNTGSGTLSWTAAADQSWLGISPAAGGGPGTASVSVSTAGLAAGTYNGLVTVTAAGAAGSPQSTQVVLTVSPANAPDTTPPAISVTAPAAGSTVSGIVAVSATATDDVGVAGVQFELDGAPLGTEDTTAPYSVSWDTSGAAAGQHTLAAVARDAAGNHGTASDVTVTVPAASGPRLVAAYSFDEGAGTSAGDSSGNGNVGALTGGTWTPLGRFGGALTFNGSGDIVRVPDSPSLHVSAGMTVEAWVYFTDSTLVWHTIAMKQAASGSSFALWATNSLARATASVTGSSTTTVGNPTKTWLYGWNHFAATYDGTKVRLYMNGAEVASTAASGALAAGTGALTIGGDSNGEYFKGRLDEVRVYDGALTPARIQADMMTGIAGGTYADPAKYGSWAGPLDWPLVAVHSLLQPTGQVLTFDAWEFAPDSERLWDPATNAFTPEPYGRNLFCSGHILLPDGRTLILGGNVTSNVGLADTTIFDPKTNTWTKGPDMANSRWYPTVTALPDGRVLVVSGDNVTLDNAGQPTYLYSQESHTLPQIYDPLANTWTSLPTAQLIMPYYPQMFVLPDGRVFAAGPDKITRALDLTTNTWSVVGNSPIDGQSAVMYRAGKIMKSGTWGDTRSDFPVDGRTAVIDFNQPAPAWRETAPMASPRSYDNLVALPDGNVLAVAGTRHSDGLDPDWADYEAELWNADTETWTTMAPEHQARMYHMSSLLLPDGRVLVAGSGRLSPAPDQLNAEIYSPPYLFKGPRPTIAAVPSTLQYNTTFSVSTPDAARIARVTLVRLGAETHSFDQNQRMLLLGFTQSGNTLTVTAPASSKLAPPGHYMLFVVDSTGVPSVAQIVRFPAPWEDDQAPTSPAGLTAVAGPPGEIDLGWTAATDNIAVARYNVYRSQSSGVAPTPANWVGQAAGTSFADKGLAAGTYRYVVTAVDAAGNESPVSNEVAAAATSDTTAPTVAMTAPAGGSTVSGTSVTVAANASDDVAVASVQFRLDGTANVGAPDTSAPYSVTWDTTAAADGPHQLTAVATDPSGNKTTSAPVSVTVSNGAAPPPSGLVAAYSFREGTGTTVADSSGLGNTGTVQNTTWSTAGKFGNALSFNGSSSWVTVNDSASLHLSNAMTLEAWVRPATLGTTWRTVLIKQQTAQLVYALYANTNTSRPSGHVYVGGDMDTRGTAALPLNAWTHLAATYDGATLKIYVNGVLASSRAVSGAMPVSTGPLRIGGNSVWGEYFSGLIDEVRVYNRALSAAEIQTDMNTGV